MDSQDVSQVICRWWAGAERWWRVVSRTGPCTLPQTPPPHGWWCIRHRGSSCLSVLGWQQSFHHRRSRESHGDWDLLPSPAANQQPGPRHWSPASSLDVTQSSPKQQRSCLTWHSCSKGSFSPATPLSAWESEDFALPSSWAGTVYTQLSLSTVF